MDPINSAPRFENLTARELMDWLRVGKKWVNQYTAARRIPGAFKTGRSWKYPRHAIELQKIRTGEVLLPAKAKQK